MALKSATAVGSSTNVTLSDGSVITFLGVAPADLTNKFFSG